MRRTLFLILSLLVADFLFQKCASPGRPTGGPKDTIPPILIHTTPAVGTLNFSSNEIIMEFSEYINADKLRNNLIITPNTEVKYKSLVKRNVLVIKIEEGLQDSTTYNFNFFNGVTDITERTPAVNLSFALSTGPFIDSLKISGTVKNLFTQENEKGMTVGLYQLTDSLNYFKDKPIYFSTTSESGKYSVNYIKSDVYQLLAFEDKNGNLTLDPDEEKHAFISENLDLQESIELKDIYTVLQDVKEIALINSRSIGQYFEIRYNKYVDNYELSIDSLFSNVVGEEKNIIRIYNPDMYAYGDSVRLIIQASDSLSNKTIDTTYLQFNKSNRKPSSFSVTYKTEKSLADKQVIKINTNKPFYTNNLSQINLMFDSLRTYSLEVDSIISNENKTEAHLFFTAQADSIYDHLIHSLPKDTVFEDSVNYTLQKPNIENPKMQLSLTEGAIVSIENDSSKAYKNSLYLFSTTKQEDFGVLKISVKTDYKNYTLQLLDQSGKVKYQNPSAVNIVFPKIEPGDYNVRILIDSNNDGLWSYGNLLKREEPEAIYLHPSTYSIRANFIIEEEISF